MVWSTGATNSRCGPLEPLKLRDMGMPPSFEMCVYSALESSLLLGEMPSATFTGSHCERIGSMYGAFRQAIESGRTSGNELKPRTSSTPGERAVVEYVWRMRSQRTWKS